MRKSDERKTMPGKEPAEGKMLWHRALHRTWARMTVLATDDSGMSTVEYAIGTIAAAAFGAILYSVVTGDSIIGALTNIINRALTTRV